MATAYSRKISYTKNTKKGNRKRIVMKRNRIAKGRRRIVARRK